jgi:hypothetical protein
MVNGCYHSHIKGTLVRCSLVGLAIRRGCRSRREGSVHGIATGKKDASKAGKLLQNPKTPKNVKSVAGSDLAQAKRRPKKRS